MSYMIKYLQCVCLGGCSTAWTNSALPSSSFAGPTAFGHWDDLLIYAGTSQTVYFGTTGTAVAPFNKGRTGTHEVGHWLNLNHIWGDDGTACTGTDNVADTPNQGGETSCNIGSDTRREASGTEANQGVRRPTQQ